MSTNYASFIAAILGMEFPSVPHHKRVLISTIGAPSIFHAQAIREHNKRVILSFKLFELTEQLKDKDKDKDK